MNLYSRPFELESALSPEEVAARIRAMVERRLFPDSRWFRFQQLRGWVLEERPEQFVLRTDDWQSKSMYASRFVGHLERAGAGTRMTGRIVTHWLVATFVTLFGLFATVAIVGFFFQHRPDLTGLDRQTIKSVAIYLVMVGAVIGMMQLSLWMAAKTIREGVLFALDRKES